MQWSNNAAHQCLHISSHSAELCIHTNYFKYPENCNIKLQFWSFHILPLACKWAVCSNKFWKESFCHNSTCWIPHVLFTLYLKFMNNYRREARFDFSKCKWSPPRATQMRKVEQRATKSRGVTHFINCVGSRSCPLEKSADLIKLPRTLEGGSSRKKWCKTEPRKHSGPYLLRMRPMRMLRGLQVSSESSVCYHI